MVFNNMSIYLLESSERVQKRAMNIIFPSLSYEARSFMQVTQHMSNLDLDHPVRKLAHSRTLSVQHGYCTRSGTRMRPLRTRTNRLKDFATMKYL